MAHGIVVPLDGSKLAARALPLAEALARASGREILLVRALVSDPSLDHSILRRWEEEQRSTAAGELEVAAAQLREDGLRARAYVAAGKAEDVISRAAAEEQADLIVMTTHGRSGVARWTLGSIADKVLRGTDTPLLLVHPTSEAATHPTATRIVVPLDGSAVAEAALPAAERFARLFHAPLMLVRAVVPTALVYGGEGLPGYLPVLEDIEAEALKYLDTVADRVRRHELPVEIQVAIGVPPDVIADAAASDGPAIVVLTSHGRSGVSRWFLGSVGDAVVRRGDVPVLVVRSWAAPGAETREEFVPSGVGAVLAPPTWLETPQELGAEPAAPDVRPHRPERAPAR